MLNLPDDIERASMDIIERELETVYGVRLAKPERHVVKRAIHASADFDYAHTLVFSRDAMERGLSALRAGATLVTDTQMACAGINKPALQALGCQAVCFMADAEVAARAKAEGMTRAAASMEKAADLPGPLVFVIGNAPTALMRICDWIGEGRLAPELVIAAPVGFVNVVESKERVRNTAVPSIVAMGRKGGSGVAAAIVNALLYQATGREQW